MTPRLSQLSWFDVWNKVDKEKCRLASYSRQPISCIANVTISPAALNLADFHLTMPEFIPPTPASSNDVRFFNWPGAGEEISEALKMTHACVIPPGASVIHVGGQAGIKSDGTVPTDLTEEIREAFSHIELSLREAGLTGTSEEVWACVYKVCSLRHGMGCLTSI